MTTHNLLYQLLYDALIELRMVGYEINNDKVIKLADLFHNLPGGLNRINDRSDAADELLTELKERAAELNIERWLDSRISKRQSDVVAAAESSTKNG